MSFPIFIQADQRVRLHSAHILVLDPVRQHGSKVVVRALPLFCLSQSMLFAAMPAAAPSPMLGQGSAWPVLTGSLAIVLLFFTWWQQARHRKKIESANEDLRKANEALRESESKWRLLFDRSADPILLLDPTRGPKFIDCNEATVKMLGYRTKEEIVALQPGELSPERQPDNSLSVPRAEEMVRIAIENGSHRFEWLTLRADRKLITTEVSMTPVQLQAKPLIVTVARDITERKRAEEALRQHQQLLNSILDNISEGVYRSSPERGLIFANKAYLAMFKYDSLEDLRSVAREELYANVADRRKLLDQLETTGAFTNQEILYKRKDGTVFWGLASSMAVFFPGQQKIDYHVGAITDITERKKAQDEVSRLNLDLEKRILERTAELRASEERLRTMVEHAPEAIVVFEADTSRFVAVNENATHLYGVSRDRLQALSPLEVSPEFQPDGRRSAEVTAEKIQEALKGKTPVFEWMHLHASGRRIQCEIRLVRLPGEGKPLIRASIIDTSERRRKERIQQATWQVSEAVHTADDLPSLYGRIHGIIQTFMPADNFHLVMHHDETGLFHFDYHVDQVDPTPAPRALTGGLNGYVVRTGKALLASRESMIDPASEWHLVNGTPSAVWLGVPLALRGSIFGVMAVQDYSNRDAYGEEEKQILTFIAEQIALAIERKRAEQALRESEEKHRALFEATSQGVMLQDEQQFLDINPAALRILGFENKHDLIGKHPAAISARSQMNGEDAAELAGRFIAECMEKGTCRFEWLARNPKGREIPLDVLLTRIQMAGKPLIQAVIMDITERKKTEAELLRSLAREKELSGLKSSFVSMVSHEFRTPLGVIMSSAEILETYFDNLSGEDREDHLRSIHKNTRRMADLMEEVLLLSRVEAGKLRFEPQSLDLSLFCRRLVDEVLSATHRRCAIDLSVEDLPAESVADERLLRHILTNLLTNAVKYSPEGSLVRFSMVRDLTKATFVVQDNGIGIASDDQQWLFNPFQRGRNVGNIPGTGLGLVIVKRCVEIHRGTIHVQSELGSGTRIEVQIPTMPAVAEPRPGNNTLILKA